MARPDLMPTRPSGDLAVDLHGVAKVYKAGRKRKVHALRGIDMRVHRGEVFGLLGPNGAGKSTLVKILMTVVRPTACAGTMLGAKVGHKPTLARVGYLPEHHTLPGHLTGRQVMGFIGALTNTDRQRRRRTGELLDRVGMGTWADTRVRGYSKGMRQRIGIAQALVNDPDLVVLDEPTDGVDPVGRRDIRDMVGQLRAQGRTVFINSHMLSELEMVCDRVAMLVDGNVVRHGRLDELTKGKERYEIELAPGPENARTLVAIATGSAQVDVDGDRLHIATSDPAPIQPIIDRLRQGGCTIREVRRFRPTLEDLFIEAVGERNAAKGPHAEGAK